MDPTAIPDCPLDDFNVFLHELRTRELRAMPPGAKTVLSGGSSGGWYFDWFRDNYPGIERHVGVEAYSPKPDGLPPEVEWIADYLGNMHRVRTADIDLVFAGQTVEHMWPEDLANFLCESHRVLRPGGWLVLDSPTRKITMAHDWVQPQHTAEYDPHEIAALVRHAGFTDVSVRGIWLCYDRDAMRVLPLHPWEDAPLTYKDRIARAAGRPEDSFIWWLEARRSSADPDRAAAVALARRVYDAAFTGYVGRTLHAVGRADGWGRNRFVRTARGENGCALYGPFVPLQPGRYAATFAVGLGREDGPAAPPPAEHDIIAEVHVFVTEGERVIARRLLRPHDLPPGELAEFTLRFDLPETAFGLQFRALTFGAVPLAFRTPAVLTDLDRRREVLAPRPARRPGRRAA